MSLSGSRTTWVFASVLLVAVGMGQAPVAAGPKGGSLEGISPYGSWEKVDAARVKAEQRKNNLLREVRCSDLPDLRFVTGFATIRDDLTRGAVSPFLIVWVGDVRVKIQLSQIASMTVRAVDPTRHRVQCTITKLPNLTPAELVKAKPTFVALSAKHTVTKTGWVGDATGAAARMAVVGRQVADPSAPEIRVAFEDIPVGATIRFHGPDILRPSNYWWAVSSVSQDPTYPYHWPPTAE